MTSIDNIGLGRNEIRILRSSAEGSPFATTFQDFRNGWNSRGLWLTLAYLELKRRYRRTILGPFWASGHIALYIACVGFIFSSVLSTDRATYIPYLTVSFLAWMFIYNSFQEASSAFSSAASLRLQIPLPYSHFIYATIWRNLLVHLHNYSLYLLVMVLYPVHVSLTLLLLIPGYLLVLANLLWISTLLATVAARYRDVTQLVAAIIQVMVFVTPIFYKVEMLTPFQQTFVLMPNLLYHLTVVLRDPLLGHVPPLSSYVVLVLALLTGSLFTAWLFGCKRKQIIFWIM